MFQHFFTQGRNHGLEFVNAEGFQGQVRIESGTTN